VEAPGKKWQVDLEAEGAVRGHSAYLELCALYNPQTDRAELEAFGESLLCARAPYSDEKVANRDNRVWHGATGNGPWMMDKSKTPRHNRRSCRYLTLCTGILDLSIIQEVPNPNITIRLFFIAVPPSPGPPAARGLVREWSCREAALAGCTRLGGHHIA
jgi:hypothetical protein